MKVRKLESEKIGMELNYKKYGDKGKNLIILHVKLLKILVHLIFKKEREFESLLKKLDSKPT